MVRQPSGNSSIARRRDGLLMLFPALLVMIYYVAFGQSQQGLSQMLRVLVIDQDAGPAGAQLVAALRAERFDGRPRSRAGWTCPRRSGRAGPRSRPRPRGG